MLSEVQFELDDEVRQVNPRHATALALLGWYLLIPRGPEAKEQDRSLSQWEQVGGFDSARSCEAKVAEERQSAKRGNDVFHLDERFAAVT